jgi:hypothetical protein
MTKIVMKRGSWGFWTAEVDGENIDLHKLDQMTALLTALVKHAGIGIEFEISDGLEDRYYVVDETGELQPKKVGREVGVEMYREMVEDKMARLAKEGNE